MNQPQPEIASGVAQLGRPKFVFRTCRKTLFWGFLLASFLGAMGIGVLLLLVKIVMADWANHALSNWALYLPLGCLLFWGGTVVGKKTNRMGQVQVVVHAGGLCYRT